MHQEKLNEFLPNLIHFELCSSDILLFSLRAQCCQRKSYRKRYRKRYPRFVNFIVFVKNRNQHLKLVP